MTNLPFALKFPAVLRTISWKTLLVCIAGVLLACTIAHAELPVAVPETTAAELARIREGNISWVAFRVLELAIPLLFLFTGLAPACAKYANRFPAAAGSGQSRSLLAPIWSWPHLWRCLSTFMPVMSGLSRHSRIHGCAEATHYVGGFRIDAQNKSRFMKSNPDLLQIEEPGWRTKCGTDGSSHVYS
jgi:hypothetical protein